MLITDSYVSDAEMQGLNSVTPLVYYCSEELVITHLWAVRLVMHFLNAVIGYLRHSAASEGPMDFTLSSHL